MFRQDRSWKKERKSFMNKRVCVCVKKLHRADNDDNEKDDENLCC